VTVSNQTVVVWAGDSVAISIALVDANGDPFVMPAGGGLEWRMARTSADADADCVVRKNLGDGILYQDGAAEIALSRFDTAVVPGIYYQQLVVVDPGTDDVSVAMTGNVVVRRALRMPRVELGSARMDGGGGMACRTIP
jgi:hypothetical protein